MAEAKSKVADCCGVHTWAEHKCTWSDSDGSEGKLMSGTLSLTQYDETLD